MAASSLPTASAQTPTVDAINFKGTTNIFVSSLATSVLGMAVESMLAYGASEELKGQASGWYQAGNLGGVGIGGGFGEGGDAERPDGGHGEGEFFDIGGDAEEDVAEAEVVEAAEELAEDDHADGGEPSDVEKCALIDDGFIGGEPGGDGDVVDDGG